MEFLSCTSSHSSAMLDQLLGLTSAGCCSSSSCVKLLFVCTGGRKARRQHRIVQPEQGRIDLTRGFFFCQTCLLPQTSVTLIFDSQNERHNRNMQREQQRIDLTRGLFLCPMCRQIANVLVPLLPEEEDASSTDLGKSDRDEDAPLADHGMQTAVTDFANACSEDAFLSGGVAAHSGGYEVVFCKNLQRYTADLGAFSKLLMRFGEREQGGEGAAVISPVEYMGVLINGLGMTIGCLELSARDPIVSALGVDEQIAGGRQRALNVLYSVSRVALYERSIWRGNAASRGAFIAFCSLRAE